MAVLIAGGERLSNVKRFADDQTVCELFTLPSIPADTSLRDDMLLIGQHDSPLSRLQLGGCRSPNYFSLKLDIKIAISLLSIF